MSSSQSTSTDTIPPERRRIVRRPNGIHVFIGDSPPSPSGSAWKCGQCYSPNFIPSNPVSDTDYFCFLPNARCTFCAKGIPLRNSAYGGFPPVVPLRWWTCCICSTEHPQPGEGAQNPVEFYKDHTQSLCTHSSAFQFPDGDHPAQFEKAHRPCWACDWDGKPPLNGMDIVLENWAQNARDEGVEVCHGGQRRLELGMGVGYGVGGALVSRRDDIGVVTIGRELLKKGFERTEGDRAVGEVFERYIATHFVPRGFGVDAFWRCCKCGKQRNLPTWVRSVRKEVVNVLPWTICDGQINTESEEAKSCCHVLCNECEVSNDEGKEEEVEAEEPEVRPPSVVRCCKCYTWREHPISMINLEAFWKTPTAGVCTSVVRDGVDQEWRRCGHYTCWQCWWSRAASWWQTKYLLDTRQLPFFDFGSYEDSNNL